MPVKEIRFLEKSKSKYSGLVFILFISFLLFNCSSDNRIDEKILAKIYVEKLIVEEQYPNKDSLKIKTDEIFKKYSISRNSYVNAVKSLDYDKEKWEEFFKYSKEYIDTLKANLNKKDLQKNKLKK
jgi:sugar diacid utilization regulator